MGTRLQVYKWSGRVLLLVLALLSVGAGLCLFDAHQHDGADGASFDLCLGFAIVSVGMVSFISVLIETMLLDPPLLLHAVPLHRLDPPPKSRLGS